MGKYMEPNKNALRILRKAFSIIPEDRLKDDLQELRQCIDKNINPLTVSNLRDDLLRR